jgi:hypothetical protein
MAFVLDMASGKEYPGEKLDCPHQGSVKTRLPDTSTGNAPSALQLAKVATQAPTQQPPTTLPGFVIETLLESIEA